MTIEAMHFLSNALDFHGIPHDTREDYSGRGMYGDETGAIVLHEHNMSVLISAVATKVADESIDVSDLPEDLQEPTGFRQDNMGLGIVIY